MGQNRKARFSKSLHLMKISSMLDSIQDSNIIVWVLNGLLDDDSFLMCGWVLVYVHKKKSENNLGILFPIMWESD